MADIIIVDDHEVIRSGLKLILDETLDIDITDSAANGDEFLEKIRKKHFDLAVLDISMEGRDIFDIIAELKYIRPNLPIVIFSMNPEEQYAIRLLKAGASGYVNKASGIDELIKAIRKVLRGGKYISPELADLLAQSLAGDNSSGAPHENLTNREFQVMCMIAEGKQLGEISEVLHLSKSTVSNHRTQVLKKLKLNNNADISRYAVKNGLV